MNKSEMWVAFAANQLTSTISINRIDDGTIANVVMSGIVDGEALYISDIVIAVLQGAEHKCCVIDARKLIIVDGLAVNEFAIECLLKIVMASIGNDIRVFLLIDDMAVQDVLSDILRRHRKFSQIVFMNSAETSIK